MRARKLGVYFSCFNEIEATRFSLRTLKIIYPDIPIYLVCESNIDFKPLEAEIPNLIVSKVEDTFTEAFHVHPYSFHTLPAQAAIKKAALALIERLDRAIDYFNSEYVLMLEPDAVVRGGLNIPSGVGLLGSRSNHNTSLLSNMNAVLKKYGGIEVKAWGATPAIFNTEKFCKAKSILLSNPLIIDELCRSFHAVFAHDIMMAILFSLIGEEETLNPDIAQIGSVPNWRLTRHPLIHQFRELYPKRTTKYEAGNW